MKFGLLGFLFAALATAAHAQSDISGGSDHPNVPRISGSVLVAHQAADYAEAEFLTLNSERKLERQYREGSTKKLVYLTPQGTTTLSAFRNYQQAFAKLGKVTEVYNCQRNCDKEIGRTLIWAKDARFPTNLKDMSRIYASHLWYTNQIYWFAKIESGSATYHVSFYASARSDYQSHRTELGQGRVLVHLQIVGNDSFESSLDFIPAQEMASAITDVGHVALYGLYFDTDQDALTAASAPTLAEVAKVLGSDPELSLYVVGHTDNVGSIENNFDLSKRRAESVVADLIADYGIARDRLVPLGAGLAAPVATNQTEDGRALNRRVELVRR